VAKAKGCGQLGSPTGESKGGVATQWVWQDEGGVAMGRGVANLLHRGCMEVTLPTVGRGLKGRCLSERNCRAEGAWPPREACPG